MAIPLPQVNALLRVSMDGVRGPLPSRVEDRDGAVLAISAPRSPADYGGRPVGKTIALTWEDANTGVVSVRGVVTRVIDDRLPIWVVRTDGRPVVAKARSHGRVTASCEVSVELIDHRPPSRLVATTTDLGAGGFRCRTEEWVMVEEGDEVRVRFGASEPPAIAAGVVVRASRVRNVLEFAVSLRQPVPERAALLLRRLCREAEEHQRLASTGRKR